MLARNVFERSVTNSVKSRSNRLIMKEVFLSRRRCLQVSALAGCSMLLGGRVLAAEEPLPADDIRPGPIALQGTEQLRSLMEQLAKAPRRRDFKTVPMILDTEDMTWTAKPDAYLAGLKKVDESIASGLLVGPAVPYVTNTLAIMMPKDNPAHITGLADLGKPGVRLAMPNPEFEGIARQIQESLEKAGGSALADMVYKTKVTDGSTVLTHIHHRQTPLFLMQGLADAGVTWQSEAMFQEQAGHPITHVDIPADQNTTAIYAGAVVKGAPHPQAARLWLSFIHSEPALTIFERYGFKRYIAGDSEKQ
jgi:ABC-type molybdate transport system substrate-binding protein